MSITLLRGDNLAILPALQAASVQCVVTSPPYFALRDYGIEPSDWPTISDAPLAGVPPVDVAPMRCCLGLEDDPLHFVGHLVHVFRLLRPVLRDDGVVWLNLGDSYAQPSKWGGRSGNKNRPSELGRYPRRRLRSESGLKDKDLMGIPWRAALALQADGWYLRSDVVWEKPDCLPESVLDRPTRSHEFLFLLAKTSSYYYDADAVREPYRDESIGRYAYVMQATAPTARQPGGDPSRYEREKGMRRPNPRGRNRRTVWRLPTASAVGTHYAPFPEALVKPCVLSGSRPGDTILDPFAGSGTTLRVAEQLGRNATGIEIKDDYIELAERRTDGVQVQMVDLL